MKEAVVLFFFWSTILCKYSHGDVVYSMMRVKPRGEKTSEVEFKELEPNESPMFNENTQFGFGIKQYMVDAQDYSIQFSIDKGRHITRLIDVVKKDKTLNHVKLILFEGGGEITAVRVEADYNNNPKEHDPSRRTERVLVYYVWKTSGANVYDSVLGAYVFALIGMLTVGMVVTVVLTPEYGFLTKAAQAHELPGVHLKDQKGNRVPQTRLDCTSHELTDEIYSILQNKGVQSK